LVLRLDRYCKAAKIIQRAGRPSAENKRRQMFCLGVSAASVGECDTTADVQATKGREAKAGYCVDWGKSAWDGQSRGETAG
jgi:hypothetical protein